MSKPIFKLEKKDTLTQILVQGNLNVQHAKYFKTEIQKSLARKGDETLHLAEASAFDISAIQIAYLWKQKLASQGRKASIIWPEGNSLRGLLDKTGITQIV